METGQLADLLQELAVVVVIIRLPIHHHHHPPVEAEVVAEVVVDTTNKTLEDPDTIMAHHRPRHPEEEITILTDHHPLQAVALKLKHPPHHQLVVHRDLL